MAGSKPVQYIKTVQLTKQRKRNKMYTNANPLRKVTMVYSKSVTMFFFLLFFCIITVLLQTPWLNYNIIYD